MCNAPRSPPDLFQSDGHPIASALMPNLLPVTRQGHGYMYYKLKPNNPIQTELMQISPWAPFRPIQSFRSRTDLHFTLHEREGVVNKWTVSHSSQSVRSPNRAFIIQNLNHNALWETQSCQSQHRLWLDISFQKGSSWEGEKTKGPLTFTERGRLDCYFFCGS